MKSSLLLIASIFATIVCATYFFYSLATFNGSEQLLSLYKDSYGFAYNPNDMYANNQYQGPQTPQYLPTINEVIRGIVTKSEISYVDYKRSDIPGYKNDSIYYVNLTLATTDGTSEVFSLFNTTGENVNQAIVRKCPALKDCTPYTAESALTAAEIQKGDKGFYGIAFKDIKVGEDVAILRSYKVGSLGSALGTQIFDLAFLTRPQ